MKLSKWVGVIGILIFSSALGFAGSGHHKDRGEHFEKQMESLDLSAQQRNEIKEIVGKSRKAAKALHAEQRKLFKAMHQVDAASLSQQQIDELSQKAGELAAERTRQHFANKAAVSKVLTPEQRQQWEQQKAEKREEMRERWKEKRKEHRDRDA